VLHRGAIAWMGLVVREGTHRIKLRATQHCSQWGALRRSAIGERSRIASNSCSVFAVRRSRCPQAVPAGNRQFE
jgi:hypothetical protein